MEKLKLLIVDDEVLIAEDLKDNLLSIGIRLIEMAHDKETAIELIKSFKPDIALLDVRMEKETDGLEIGEYLNANTKTPFIYITAHSDIEMIKRIVATRPVGYITKPFKKSDVFAAINLALQQNIKATSGTLFFKDGYDTIKIDTGEFMYAESDGNYIHIYTINKKYTIRFSLDWLMTQLPAKGFNRVHRSYVVNTEKINKYTAKSVFINSVEIPVARDKKLKR